MPQEAPWYDSIVLPALLRHARTTYGKAMRRALAEADCDDVPRNGIYVIGGLALGAGGVPLSRLTVTLTPRGQAAAAAQAKARERIDADLLARVGEKHVKATRATLAALIGIGRDQSGNDEDDH
jgi:hypothetical protein